MRELVLKTVFLILLLLASSSALAFVMTVDDPVVEVGDTVTFRVTSDAGDTYSLDFPFVDFVTLNIFYDPTILSPLYASTADIQVDTGLPGHDVIGNYFVFDDPGLLSISFTPDEFTPHVGPSSGELAMFSFEAIGVGSSTVSLGGIADVQFGCDFVEDSCYLYDVFFEAPIAGDATVQVIQGGQQAVPLPGPVYLFLIGFGAVTAARRLRKRA